MELIIHIVAILSVVQTTWSATQTSEAPPFGSQNPAHTNSSTTQAPEIRTEFPVSSPSQRTISNVNFNTGTTLSLLVETTKTHSEQNFANSSREAAGRTTNSPTNSPTRPVTSQPFVSASSQNTHEMRTTIETTRFSTESRLRPSTSQPFVTSLATSVPSSKFPSEEVLLTTSEDPSETPIPGESGLRSSPRVASEFIVTSIKGVTESEALIQSKATSGIDIDTDFSTPIAAFYTTLEDLDTAPGTDLMDTQLPDATTESLSTGQTLTTGPPNMSLVSTKSETTEPSSSVDALVTDLPEVTEVPTEFLTTDASQTIQTSFPSFLSTAFTTSKQPLEMSTMLNEGTDATPSAFDLVSLEATTLQEEIYFDTTEIGTLPTTTSSPMEIGSIGTPPEAVSDVGMTDETNPATDLQEMETELITDGEVEGTLPLELWTLETSTSSEEVTDFEGTDHWSTESYDSMTETYPTTTLDTPVFFAPCLCEVETALLSARVCLCNSSLALSNYTYHAHLVRRNHNNRTHPEVRVNSTILSSGSGCWNLSVPLGGSYRLVVTAEDGLGNIASTPTAYFYSGLIPPYLSVEKVPGAMPPSLELYWQYHYPTYVDYVTIYVSRDNAPATQLTWMRVEGVRTFGEFTFVTSGLGSMYTVTVEVQSGTDSATSNSDTVVIAPPHPAHVRIANVTPELLTVQWPHDTSSCRGSCSYLVRYKQASPYSYNTYPVKELPISCPSLLPAQPARSTNPNPISTCTAYLRNLIPGVLYDVDVYAISYRVLSETAAQLRMRTPPARPQNVTVTNVTERSITISWTPGAGYRTRYRLHAFAHSYSGEAEVRGDVTDFTFHDLLAGTQYIITIRASANSTDGDMVFVGETTVPTKPGPVDGLRLEPQVDHRQIRLAFLAPVWPNGVLEGYQVEYIGKRDGSRTCNSGQKYLPVVERSVIIDGLKGGCNYTFTVRARNEVGLGPGVSNWILTAVGIPQVPESTPPPPPAKTIKSTNFVVNFDPSVFDDVDGEITHVIVIVAESSATIEPAQSNSSLPRMKTWAEAISNDVIPPYQISEPINLSDPAQDSRRKRNVVQAVTPTSIRKIGIGTEECSYDNLDVYCNGPLIHGRSYVYRFRGISAGGYADTKTSDPVVLPVSPKGVIIGISTALFSLLVIVIILSIVVIVRKFRLDGRGRYLPANMKDVEMTRVANNTQSTISKQKYSRPVRLTDFTRDWFSMNADSNYGYSQEYEAIRKVGRKMTTNTAVSPANVAKNRYTNILPYDRTRVKLSSVDDEEGSDYINANYIPGFSSPREYIACQGPLPGTTDDMWRMIWEQNVTTVVMVTQLVEKGKVKCDQYWPDDHMPVLYGDIQVTMNQTIEENDWNIKEFAVQLRDQRRYVRHWNFLSWPDHGVPDSSQALLAFIRRIRSTNPPSTTPMAVHCSAGVGRTGTFIVLDHLLQHMEQYDFVDVMGVVCGMRMHRNFMVQTEQQYVFIHRCLMDVIEERGLAPVPMMSGSLP